MKLILVDTNSQLCLAWEKHFYGISNIEIVNDRFENLVHFDCMVSPANSFGLMDGGIDAAIIRFFGNALMKVVQDTIQSTFFGEQPIGTSFVVPTGNLQHPWLAHTPTMRICKPIYGTDNVYNAMRAMLIAVISKFIETVACPGLGTLTGRVPPDEAARQMAAAYRQIMHAKPVLSWKDALQLEADAMWSGK